MSTPRKAEQKRKFRIRGNLVNLCYIYICKFNFLFENVCVIVYMTSHILNWGHLFDLSYSYSLTSHISYKKGSTNYYRNIMTFGDQLCAVNKKDLICPGYKLQKWTTDAMLGIWGDQHFYHTWTHRTVYRLRGVSGVFGCVHFICHTQANGMCVNSPKHMDHH